MRIGNTPPSLDPFSSKEPIKKKESESFPLPKSLEVEKKAKLFSATRIKESFISFFGLLKKDKVEKTQASFETHKKTGFEKELQLVTQIKERQVKYHNQISKLENSKQIMPIKGAALRQVVFFTNPDRVKSISQYDDIVMKKAEELGIPLEDVFAGNLSNLI